MPDGGGETPINDIDTTLNGAGVEDLPAAEAPALSVDVEAATEDSVYAPVADVSGEDDELVPLQIDEAPAEDVTLALTRDDSAPADVSLEVIPGEVSAADDIVLPTSDPVEAPVPELRVEIPAALEAPSEDVTPTPAPAFLMLPDAVTLTNEPDDALLAPATGFAIVSNAVVVDTADVLPAVAETVVPPEEPPIDFFAPATIETIESPVALIDPAVDDTLPVAPGAVEQFAAMEAAAPVAPVIVEASDAFEILSPRSATLPEEIVPAEKAVAEVEKEEENEPDPEPVREEEAELVLVGAGTPADEGGAGAWSIAALCLGVAIIACAVLIPQTDFNRRLVYEREKLRRDLASIEQQVKVNDEFLQRVSSDPSLAERLAQRQMKIIRKGTKVLELQNDPPEEMSPYQLVAVPPPAPLPAYEPKRDMIANACYGVRSRLYLMGAGLMLMAAGLVFGAGPTRE